MTTNYYYFHTLDGEPCAVGPEYPDDALCAEHGRLWRRVGITVVHDCGGADECHCGAD